MDAFLQAEKALEGQEYEKAYKLYASILSETENKALVYQGLATSLYYLRRYDEALKASRSAIELEPDLGQSHLIAAFILRREGNIVDCKKEAKIALDLKPEMPDVLGFNAELLMSEKDLENAFVLLEKAIKLDPSHWRSHYDLGSIYRARKLYKDAFSQYKISFRLHPSIKTYLRLDELYSSVYRTWYQILMVLVIVAVVSPITFWIPMVTVGYFMFINISRLVVLHDKKAWKILLLDIFLLACLIVFRP